MREVLQQMTAGCSKRQQGVLTVQNQNHGDKPRVLAGPRGLRAGPPGRGPGLWLEPHLCLCAMSPSASLTQDSLPPRPLIQELLKTPCHAGHSAGLRDGAWDVRACIQPTTPAGAASQEGWEHVAQSGLWRGCWCLPQPRGGGEPWKLRVGSQTRKTREQRARWIRFQGWGHAGS